MDELSYEGKNAIHQNRVIRKTIKKQENQGIGANEISILKVS
jgi:hypothetical protein